MCLSFVSSLAFCKVGGGQITSKIYSSIIAQRIGDLKENSRVGSKKRESKRIEKTADITGKVYCITGWKFSSELNLTILWTFARRI